MVSWTQVPQINASNFTGIFWNANEVTGGMFGTAIVFVVWLVIFISFMSRRPVDQSFLVTNFLTFGLVWMLRLIGIVGDKHVVVLLIMTLLSLVIIFREKMFSGGGS